MAYLQALLISFSFVAVTQLLNDSGCVCLYMHVLKSFSLRPKAKRSTVPIAVRSYPVSHAKCLNVAI